MNVPRTLQNGQLSALEDAFNCSAQARQITWPQLVRTALSRGVSVRHTPQEGEHPAALQFYKKLLRNLFV